MNKAIFLDRDGVINVKRNDYVKNINEFIMLKDVPKAIRMLNEEGFLVIIITNQSAVNRNLVSHDELAKIHDIMKIQLQREQAFVNAIYYCPHRPDENCKCRKPKAELILRAIRDHSISPSSSWLIGDSESDVQAAKEAGVASIRIQENGSLLEAVNNIVKQDDLKSL
jgi:histidinol-phosphate phosphatase family protein